MYTPGEVSDVARGRTFADLTYEATACLLTAKKGTDAMLEWWMVEAVGTASLLRRPVRDLIRIRRERCVERERRITLLAALATAPPGTVLTECRADGTYWSLKTRSPVPLREMNFVIARIPNEDGPRSAATRSGRQN
jgi:hypothetical protein